eukprot:TRINITY_DN427_c0_g1_i4.p1 TRINITY_DN427_c0_g1~~TRINITY_DN427_c0_g1_i4.p1  ORF type:complete len:184 (-),score=36.59 TRINITY_DN427_c0_g1_i4:259-810(-)
MASLTKSISFRTTNKISSKLASSNGGKKLLKEFADDSVFDALTSLKNFVTRVSNNPKEGEEFEKNVLRLATKLALHFKNNQITKDELKVFKIPMKVTASLIIKCHEEPDPNFDVARIDKHFEVLRTHMKVLCAKHLHDKSLERLQFILNYTTAANMKAFMTEESHKKDLEILARSLSKLLWDS